MAINIYPAPFEFSISAKTNHGTIFFAQRCNASLLYDNDMTLCAPSTQQFSLRKYRTVVIPFWQILSG
jgi:hypothetical protein